MPEYGTRPDTADGQLEVFEASETPSVLRHLRLSRPDPRPTETITVMAKTPIIPAIDLAGLNLLQARTIYSEWRDIRLELRPDAARECAELRDRQGRVEGNLDVLREFFVGSGREPAN